MLVIVPTSLLGQSPAAILRTQGGVWVNNYEAKDGSAVFTGDVLETRPGFSANLSLEGSELVIQTESVTKFQADFLELDHGSTAVRTSKSFAVRVNCLRVVPVAGEWTQYEVSDVNGTVQVTAHQREVNVEIEGAHGKTSEDVAGSRGGTVHEGEQHSYTESDLCRSPERSAPAGPAINPKWIPVGAGVAGVLIWIAVRGGGGSTPPPLSASAP